MANPIDYSIDVATPFQSALQGYQAGAAIRDDQFKQQQLEAAQAQKQQMQTDLGAVMNNPNASARDYATLTVKYPQLREQLKQGWDMVSKEQQGNKLDLMTRAYSALSTGRADVAERLMRDQSAAMRNSGASEKDIQAQDMWADLIKASPEQARHIGGLMLSSVMDPDKFSATFTALGDQGRAADKAPAEKQKSEAEARIKTAEASAAVDKVGADLGLTRAQIDETKKRTEKLGSDIQKLALEAQGSGGLDPEKRFDFESKLRKEYATQTGNFQDVKESFGRIKAAENTGAGDIALVYAYMKMLDPGSVVREGEFATASNSAGVPAAIQNLYNKALNGERLTDGQRKTFTGQAERLMKAAEVREKEVRGGIDQVVKSYKLNPDNVFYTPSAAPAAAPGAPAAAAAAGALPPALANKGWAKY